MEQDPLELGAAIAQLLPLESGRQVPMPLLPAAPRACPQLAELRGMSPGDLFGPETVQSGDDAKCVQAGLYLYFSALDESHTVSQTIHTASGSYWHGIMHRQEGDWGNAKYWFRRVGRHPVLAELGEATGEQWDPFEFVDRCRAAAGGGSGIEKAMDRQMLEWRLLMLHCYRNALGL